MSLLISILAAVFLPRFLDTRDAAMAARLESMAGTMRTATGLIHAQARLEDRLDGFDAVAVQGASVQLHSGYPRAHWMLAMRF